MSDCMPCSDTVLCCAAVQCTPLCTTRSSTQALDAEITSMALLAPALPMQWCVSPARTSTVMFLRGRCTGWRVVSRTDGLHITKRDQWPSLPLLRAAPPNCEGSWLISPAATNTYGGSHPALQAPRGWRVECRALRGANATRRL